MKRSQILTRYYLAERLLGYPADMGWVSQAAMLVVPHAWSFIDLHGSVCEHAKHVQHPITWVQPLLLHIKEAHAQAQFSASKSPSR